MDELNKIRSAFPEQPGPSPHVTDQARRQVQALAREAATARRRDRLYAAAKSGRAGIGLTAVAASVALAALAAPIVLGPGSGPDAGPVPSTVIPTPRLMTASQVLLATAVKQEKNEKVSGKYYRVRSLQLRVGTRVGSPKYTLERRSITESWMPMKQGVESWFGWVDLGARPATPGDTAKWKAQGSPRSWQLNYEVDPVTMDPNWPTVRKMTFDEVPPGYYLSGVRPVTAKQIQALPTDPAKLRTVLAAGAEPGATAEEIDYTDLQRGRPAALRDAVAAEAARCRAPRAVRTAGHGAQGERQGRDRPDRYADHDGVAEDGGRCPQDALRRRRYQLHHRCADRPAAELASPSASRSGASVVLESGWTDEKPTAPSRAVR